MQFTQIKLVDLLTREIGRYLGPACEFLTLGFVRKGVVQLRICTGETTFNISGSSCLLLIGRVIYLG